MDGPRNTDRQPPDMAALRELVAATVTGLKQLSGMIHLSANADVGPVAGELGELAALAGAGVVAVAEAEQRGIVQQSQFAGTAAWVRDQVWHLQTGGSSLVAKCAAILRRAELSPVAAAIRTADVTPAVAVAVAVEYDKLAPKLLTDAHQGIALDAMIEIGAEHGPAAVRQLHQLLLTRYGADGEFQDEQDSRKRYVELSSGREDGGIYRYELTVDAEGRAVLEAAIGPLCKPQPEPDGTADPRPVGRRRGEALVEVCRRAVAAGGQVPTATKAQLFVTSTLDELRRRCGAGRVVGSLDNGSLLGPETVRRLACDAGIIPVVLGSNSEPLDVGRTQRLFTPAQLKALWLRDKHCTFPGCHLPAHWTDAHHLRHWIDGGPTDLDNGALLCGRHHTVVHRDQLAGTIIDGHVLWTEDPAPTNTNPPPSPSPILPARDAVRRGQSSDGTGSEPPMRPTDVPTSRGGHEVRTG